MNIVLTLDYEIYFGAHSGSAERTLLEPTEALCRLARHHGVRLVFFVDALWLLRLREEAPRHTVLMAEHYRVSRQLEAIARAGHELQLHLHPHWQDTAWDGKAWHMDLRRYRLHSFADADITEMTRLGSDTLRALAGATPVSAFRAGGWCIQPFERLRQPLLDAGIRIDSTVYSGGRQQGDAHSYDFTQAPEESHWRFERDPLLPQHDGSFLEVPIASHQVSPWWFWRMAAARKLGLPGHRALGEGSAVGPSRADLARKLLQRTTSVVSLDGMKSGFLEAAWRHYQRLGMDDFVVIGHPKALTPYSLRMLETFLRRHADEPFVGLNAYRHALRTPQFQAA
ncbi:MAG: hypothetical protein Q8K45_10355 [Rubrivivax sp.]|nr:hypothetical protein [Rubrivivax sp.]